MIMATFENLSNQWQKTLLNPAQKNPSTGFSKSFDPNFKISEMGNFSNSNVGNSGDLSPSIDNQLSSMPTKKQSQDSLFNPIDSFFNPQQPNKPLTSNQSQVNIGEDDDEKLNNDLSNYLKGLGYDPSNTSWSELRKDPKVDYNYITSTKEKISRSRVNKYLKQLGYSKTYDNVTIGELERDPRVDKNIFPLLVERNFSNMARTAKELPTNMSSTSRQITDFRNSFAPPGQQPILPAAYKNR